MNLIVSDLAIIFIGIPIDAMGAFTKRESLDAFLCPSVAFVHTIFGTNMYIPNQLNKHHKTGLGIPISFLIRVYILGMSSLYTLTAMAAIRFKSVIWHDRSWHLTTHVTYFTSRYVQLLWLFAFAVAIPPIIGLGKYAVDFGMIRYNSTWPFWIELFYRHLYVYEYIYIYIYLLIVVLLIGQQWTPSA